jgi:hypothetical protein
LLCSACSMFTQWAASSTATIWAWGTSALAFCALLYGKLTSCLPHTNSVGSLSS